MFTRRNNDHTLGERAILGDEELADLLHTVADLSTSISDLQARVDAQFTTIAAHAEIARQQSELMRREARADLDRTRDTVIGLIERVREERTSGIHAAGSRGDTSTVAVGERCTAIEGRISELGELVERSLARQHQLADTVASFVDTITAERHDEPVAGLALI